MIPETIPFSSVLGMDDRVRKTYTGIEELAAGIETLGLMQPILLTATPEGYRLVDGGRRMTALKLLGCETLYHAKTCHVGQPGFLVREETDLSPLMLLLTEISANKDREDIPWYEELPAIVQAWEMIQREHHARGEEIAMRAFGAMLGVSYQDLHAAVHIWQAYTENPMKFQEYTSVRQAYQRCLRDAADAAAKVHVAQASQMAQLPKPKVQVQDGPQQSPAEVMLVEVLNEPDPIDPAIQTVPISQMFRCCNSLDFMESFPKGFVQHIFTDPDYAISAEQLNANSNNMDRGVAQASVEDSLADLRRFIVAAHHCVDDHGYCIFFFDQEHWEKLRDFSSSVGWRVQRWPLIWRKSDYKSNASAQHNFTKNYETAMVLRKPGACLATHQNSSVMDWPMSKAVQMFNHPFAKPIQVWRWLFEAITRKGDKVYDPFLGSGSMAAAAVEHGLAPMGSELVDTHFANAMINIQVAYQTKLGKVNFQ